MTPTEDQPTELQQPPEPALDEEQLAELAEDRYVVRPAADDHLPAEGKEDAGMAARDAPGDDNRITSLDGLDGHFALAATARTGAGSKSVRIDSNDVSETFETLLRWYADVIAEETPQEEVIEVLFAHADIEFRTRG